MSKKLLVIGIIVLIALILFLLFYKKNSSGKRNIVADAPVDKEFLGDIVNAKILYIWSYRLFKSLTYDVISQFDKTVIDGFMIKIKERINECLEK